jgi:hypothetical protein
MFTSLAKQLRDIGKTKDDDEIMTKVILLWTTAEL